MDTILPEQPDVDSETLDAQTNISGPISAVVAEDSNISVASATIFPADNEASAFSKTMDPDELAAEFGLSTHFTSRLIDELGKRETANPSSITTETRDLLQVCSGLFKGTSTRSLGVYFLGDEDSSQEEFLGSAKSHFLKMKELLGGDTARFFKREIYYRQRIDDTPYYLVIRRGFLENNWGIEFAIGTEEANWQRTEDLEDQKDLARIGVNFDNDSVRIVNVEGVEHAKKLINKHMPKTLRHKPLNLLILLVAMWANEQGFGKIKGIRNSHQKYLEGRLDAAGQALSYEKIFSAVGMTVQGDAWMGADSSEFYDQLLAQLSPAQADGFDDVSTAFASLKPLDRNGDETWSDYPFYLRDDVEVIGPLMNTIRYDIRKHLAGFGPTRAPKKTPHQ